MCGIAGYVGGFVPELAARMNAAQAHRGPDGQGLFEDPGAEVALGHVRLAILDLTDHAAQPMHTPDGRYVLVYNGELYNFAELRQELLGRGQTLTSTGDTEVLLRALQEYGASCLGRLNGMFAFALWDRRERELLLVRDPLGIKPLYYAEPESGSLVFASEIKALCAHPKIRREPDFEALQQHLAYCHASGERTALRGIKRLPPGSWLRWRADTRRFEIGTYWRPSYDAPPLPKGGAGSEPDGGRARNVEELRTRVQEATRLQLVADVPVGSFLSGGLDSSLLTAIAATEVGTRFQCYTITYPAAENVLDRFDDDAPHARQVAASLGLQLREIEIKPEVASLWPHLLYHLDEPIADPAAISCYLISKLARESGTTVLLSGQGADELFCGYPRYAAMAATRWLGRIPRPVRRAISHHAARLPGAREGNFGAGLRRIRRVATAMDQDADERFLSYCSATPETEIRRILSPAVAAELQGRRFKDDCLQHMEASGLRGLAREQDRDVTIYLPNHNLLYTDKMGMAVGLEARVPFLDLDLADRATRYPARWKFNRGTTKALLRDAARGLVSDAIIDRRKAGFGAPYRKWLRYDLAEMWGDVMSEDAVRRRGWFDHRKLEDARRRSQEGKADLYMLQWSALTLELWARRFLDQDPSLT